MTTLADFLVTSVSPHIHLVAIATDRQTRGGWFGDDVAAAVTWAEQANAAGWNLYWTANTVRTGLHAKPAKTDITDARWAHVDIDPPGNVPFADWDRPGALARLAAMNPSLIIDSGGGFQGLWRLDRQIVDQAAVEAVNRGISARLGGDPACWNIDRLLRLPGTVNYPDERKRARGRVEAMATLVQPDTGQCFTLEALAAAFPPVAAAAPVELDVLGPWEVMTLEQLVPAVAEGDRRLVEAPRGLDRSNDVYLAACALARYGHGAKTITGILMNPDYTIHAHIADQPYADRAAARAALKSVADAGVAAVFQAAGTLPVGASATPVIPSVITLAEAPSRLWEGPPPPADKNSHLFIEWWIAKVDMACRYNEFSDDIIAPDGTIVTDALINETWLHCRAVGTQNFPKLLFEDTFRNIAWQRRFHPVRDYLASVQGEWDGSARIDRWLVDIVGAADTPLTRAVGLLWLVAAVRRVRVPGCKFDELLTLEGPQGTNKSSLFEILCPRQAWFTDAITMGMSIKEILEVTTGKWIVEAPELSRLSDSGIEHVKSMLSRRFDRARLAYGRQATDKGRGFLWAGTTNAQRYFKDKSGNRRFWPVRVGRIDLGAAEALRDQLWGEAAVREAAGASIRLDSSLWAAAAIEQEERMEDDPLEEIITFLLAGLSGRIRSEAIWDAAKVPPDRRKPLIRSFGETLQKLGWSRKQISVHGDKIWHYIKGGEAREIIFKNGSGLIYVDPDLKIAVPI